MAKDNIYDLTISEIILRLSAITTVATSTAALVITSSIGLDSVQENFNGTHTFTSEVVNMPTGYTVQASTHVITTPTTPITTTGSTDSLTTADHSVILGAIGSTYVVTSTVIIEHATLADITLTATHTITSVLPIYHGVKTLDVGTPTIVGLGQMSYQSNSFKQTVSAVGRIYVVIPTAYQGADFKGIQGPNGLLIPSTDFTNTTVGSLEYWILNYDTQLTGAHTKNYLIIYDSTGTLVGQLGQA